MLCSFVFGVQFKILASRYVGPTNSYIHGLHIRCKFAFGEARRPQILKEEIIRSVFGRMTSSTYMSTYTIKYT